MDHILPIPQPDWNQPEPSDASEPEETDARAALTQLRHGLRSWLLLAAMESLPPIEWRKMVALLHTTAEMCALADTDPVATHFPALIVIQPHPAGPRDGVCVRCELPVADPVHGLGEPERDHQP
jgi:hypothetical protein